MGKSKDVLFIYLTKSTFVEADLKILQEKYKVNEVHFFKHFSSNLLLPLNFLIQFLVLFVKIRRADIIFGWFCDVHMFIPSIFAKWFNKRLYIVLGGVDTVNIPEINHGVFASSWRAPIARYIYNRADVILPVSSSMIESTNEYTYSKKHEFGLKKEIGTISADVKATPTGYNDMYWRFDGEEERPPVVTTVAFINSKKRIWIKGIDLFIELAEQMPMVTFQVVGVESEIELGLKIKDLKNLKLMGSKTSSDLVDIYNASSIYMQASRLEGFPNVLCEAMLCGCIPVGSNVFGIPEIIGDQGYILQKPDVFEMKTVIEDALSNSKGLNRSEIRDSIISRFSIEKRKKSLFELIG